MGAPRQRTKKKKKNKKKKRRRRKPPHEDGQQTVYSSSELMEESLFCRRCKQREIEKERQSLSEPLEGLLGQGP